MKGRNRIYLKGGDYMAVVANKLSTALQLKVKTGTDEKGNDVIATQTYRNVKIDAADADIYSVAQSIGSLESTPVISVVRADSVELVNQA
jgi:hypothetical protein